ncbi:MAG: hypothetical protein OXE57_00655 [Alphaproteobacteria bacterium]|nr:hypothetical protein [Alphaproteobacteria bacterium]
MKRTILSGAALVLSFSMALDPAQAEEESYRTINYTSHHAEFFGELLSGKVWIFHNPKHPKYRNVPHALLFEENGQYVECKGWWTDKITNRLHWVEQERVRWEVENNLEASIRTTRKQESPKFKFLYYDRKTGALTHEIRRRNKDGNLTWMLHGEGWVQDSWPRLFADGCPSIDLPAGMKVNEKQTSSSLRKLREQDPDAPIRNFPGSHLTGPGRVGIAANDVPTTTRREVWAFLSGQEGNVMRGPEGHGRVFVRGAEGSGQHEIWGLKDEGGLAWTAELVEYEESGHQWFAWKFKGKVVARYRMGDPLPYLPTGRRHGAWQLTDEFLGRPYPRSLPHMGAAYADKRFVFHSEGKFSVVDRNGDLVEGPHFDGVWRWTKGRLEMTVRDDPAGPRSIGWRELASGLDMQPTVWTRSTPDRID